MAERLFTVGPDTAPERERRSLVEAVPRRGSLCGTASSFLSNAARVAYCFRVLGGRGAAAEIAHVLALQIKERRRRAASGVHSGGKEPGDCSWVNDAGEWTVADLKVTYNDLAAFVAETRFPRFYYPGSRRVRYALWHKIGFDLCGLTPSSVVLDAGAGMGIWGGKARRQFGCTVWDVDGRYAPGRSGHRIGAAIGKIPLPANSVSHVVSFCSFNCFEGPADTEFLWESFRLLRPGGKLVIVPLCICDDHVNLFDPSLFPNSGTLDPGAHQRPWLGWGNRFGRWYDRQAFRERLILRGPAFQRTIVRVAHDLPFPDLARGSFAALFVKPAESA